MLQIKNGAIKATLNRNRREAAVPAATWRCEEEEKAVCRGEARTRREEEREAQEADLRQTETQNCCTAGCFV